jgi:anti-anti-sigma factor
MSVRDVPVLVPPTELTHETMEAFEALVLVHLEGQAPGLVVDLMDVEFVNSSGLGTLVRAGLRLDAREKRFALARPSASVERAIRLVGLDEVLPLFATVREALGFVTSPRRPAPADGAAAEA